MDDRQAEYYAANIDILLFDIEKSIQVIRAESEIENEKDLVFQLSEISQAIERLEKRNVSVPESLYYEKNNLREKAFKIEDAKQKLEGLRVGLQTIINNIEPASRSTNAKARNNGEPKAPRGKRQVDDRPFTRSKQYRPLIFEYLRSHGGKAPSKDVIAYIGDQMEGQFTEKDLEYSKSSNGIVWKNAVRWERLFMVDDGILKRGSPIGIWELADE